MILISWRASSTRSVCVCVLVCMCMRARVLIMATRAHDCYQTQVAVDPIEHTRNSVVTQMLRPRAGLKDLITRGDPTIVEAVLAEITLVLGHSDERVRKCGVSILGAVVEPGDPEATIQVAQWLQPAQGEKAAAVRLSCSDALRAIAGTNNTVAQGRLANLASDNDWCKRLAAVRALALMTDSQGANEMCEFLAKVAARDEHSAVRWTCLKAINALSNSSVDKDIVLENFDMQRAELLSLLRSKESEHSQRVEAVRILGKHLRACTCARTRLHVRARRHVSSCVVSSMVSAAWRMCVHCDLCALCWVHQSGAMNWAADDSSQVRAWRACVDNH